MSIADDLARLEDQHSHGVLSDAEFRRAKERLLDGDDRMASTTQNERQWGMFVHLAVFAGAVIPLGGLIVPIVLWQVKKDEYPSVDIHGRNLMNGMITAFIYAVIGAILLIVWIGVLVLIPLAICTFVFPIIAALKANDGVIWKYPFAIEFFSVPSVPNHQ